MMTKEEKLDLIAKFEGAYGLIDEMIKGLPKEALHFVPNVEGAWSINDFLVHLLDADAGLNFRLRGCIAEPGITAPVWDEEVWHAKLHYEVEDGPACLELAKGLRRFMAASLRALVDEDWSLFHYTHSTRGRMDLVALIDMYRGHVAFHAPLIKRNREAWLARKG